MALPFICLQFQQGGTGHHSALGHGLNGKLIGVGHNNGCSYIITVRFDAVKVKFHQKLTFFHSLAVLDLAQVNGLALQGAADNSGSSCSGSGDSGGSGLGGLALGGDFVLVQDQNFFHFYVSSKSLTSLLIISANALTGASAISV